MIDPVTAAAAGLAGYRLIKEWLKPRESQPLVHPAPLRREKPTAEVMPLFTPHRGGHRTTLAAAAHALRSRPGPLFEMAGALWPAREYLNKLLLFTGRPGAGKTTMQKLMMGSVAELFPELVMRWFVIDPTNAYLPFLFQILPEDVEIIRATPSDAQGWRWNVRADITSETLNEAFQTALFPDSLFKKSGDPFWMTKAREVAQAIVTLYLFLGAKWEFWDLVIPIKYPQFLKPILRQCPLTKGTVKHDLVGRLGRDIVTTCSSVINRMATAAAQWQHARYAFSLTEFLDNPNRVMHFAFTPEQMAALSGIANAMSYTMLLLALQRNDEWNHTYFWMDESRFLDAITGMELMAARGRGSGIGATFSIQAKPGAEASWGKERAAEMFDLVSTWVTFSAGYQTAADFCRAVGQVEGIEKSYGTSDTASTSRTTTHTSGGSRSGQGVGGGRNVTTGTNWGTSHSTTMSFSHSRSENFKLTTRDAVLPGEITNLPYADSHTDSLEGFAFNPDVGAFHFEVPFLEYFAGLSPAPFSAMPLRPADQQVLQPWNKEDLLRLGFELTPDLMKALTLTWGLSGGVS